LTAPFEKNFVYDSIVEFFAIVKDEAITSIALYLFYDFCYYLFYSIIYFIASTFDFQESMMSGQYCKVEGGYTTKTVAGKPTFQR